jgi:hypothetical protein
MAALAAVATAEPSDLDWHRILDAVVLIRGHSA